MKKETIKYNLPFFIFLLFAVLILAPLYKEGFILLMDMPWSPNLQLKDYIAQSINSNLPITILIKAVSLILPLEVIQKIILTFVLFLPGASMYLLSRKYLPVPWAILSGVFFMINPYVYERFLAGYWYVLLGYGFFPFLVKAFLEFLENKTLKRFLIFTILFSIYPIISQHWAYIGTMFILLLGLVYIFLNNWIPAFAGTRKKELGNKVSPLTKQIIKFAAIFYMIFFSINSFWLFSVYNGTNKINNIIKNDLEVYATQPDYTVGTFFNVLSLYGFWQRDFLSPKNFSSFWWIWTVIILLFSFVGAVLLIRKKNLLAITLAIAFIPTIFIAVGYTEEFTRVIVEFLFAYIPGFRGLRETAKIVGILAFTYALFLPAGTLWIKNSLTKDTTDYLQKVITTVLFLTVLSIPILTTHTFFWGARGQLDTSIYPQSWFIVDQKIKQSPQSGKILVFPWWAYLNFPFTQNRTIANPSVLFFENPTIQSQRLNNESQIEQQREVDLKVEEVLKNKKKLSDLKPYFQKENITHIILLKVNDWRDYSFLERSEILKKEYESEEIVLYTIQ